jgi:zinc D-Ala-D-Ala carboxypeptidase
MNLAKNFTLEELCYSIWAVRNKIDNMPNEEQIENLKLLCENILQPLRDALGLPIHSNSGFRNPEVNLAVGGAKNSQHQEGKADDITVVGMTPMDVIKKIVELKLPFDQLIFEYGQWAHVSFNKEGNRGQLLSKTHDVEGYPELIL